MLLNRIINIKESVKTLSMHFHDFDQGYAMPNPSQPVYHCLDYLQFPCLFSLL
jgi:hypothetical protein